MPPNTRFQPTRSRLPLKRRPFAKSGQADEILRECMSKWLMLIGIIALVQFGSAYATEVNSHVQSVNGTTKT